MSIVERVRELNLPLGKYVVFASGTLEALGIRKARDIDITVLPDLHAELRATGAWEEETRYGKIFLKRNGVEINPQLDWSDYPTTTEEAIASAVTIEGIPFMNLNELRRFKVALGREKDLIDIALIDAYISTQS